MERKKLLIIVVAILFLVPTVLDWYLNFDYGSDGRAIDPETRLSDAEARRQLGTTTQADRNYFWSQKSVLIKKRTWIPFITKTDTIAKQQKVYYSRDK